VRIIESSDIAIARAGLYSWFQDYNEACVNTQNSQVALVQIQNAAGSVNIFNFVTIGTVSTVDSLSYQATEQILAIPNTDAVAYPWWSLITVL
jgi:glucan 1,3-beta-glucosidase